MICAHSLKRRKRRRAGILGPVRITTYDMGATERQVCQACGATRERRYSVATSSWGIWSAWTRGPLVDEAVKALKLMEGRS